MTHRVTPDRSTVFTLFTKHSLVTTRFQVVIFPSSDDQFVPGYTSHLCTFVKILCSVSLNNAGNEMSTFTVIASHLLSE